MRIAFLCGTLEPGYDGVGDYTRRLATELIRQGHQIAVVALNDKYISEVMSGMQQADDINLEVFRIPSNLAEKERFDYAGKWIEAFNPELLSLQFVIFAFHSKGLPLALGKKLSILGNGRIWHIMFHELWVGMPTHSPKKHILWGWIQRYMIRSLIKRVKPSLIHTQTWLYQKQLALLGVRAELLPLFSNISPTSAVKVDTVSNTSVVNNPDIVQLIVFGSIHSYSQIEIFTKEAASFTKRSGKKILMKAIGRCGPELERWVHIWKLAGLYLEVLGEQSPERISEVLGNASIGITTTALPMVQKSGSVAAMREHGLPVICIAGPWHPRGIKVPAPPAGIFNLRHGIIEECLTANHHNCSSPSVLKVSSQFMDALKNIK